MDGHRQIDGRFERTGPTALTDESFDREIESLLAAEPSPEFVARVRTHVASELAPSGWRTQWSFALSGAVGAVIVTVMAWPSGEPASSITVPVQRSQVAQVVTPSAPPEVVPTPRRGTTPRVTREAAAASRATETTVATGLVPIVAEEDARAFDALLATIRDPGVMLVFDHEAPASALSTSAIAISPITIQPLPTTLEGGVE